MSQSYLSHPEIAYAVWKSPLGPLGLTARDGTLSGITLKTHPETFPFLVERTYGAPGVEKPEVFETVTRQLDEYFQGKRLVFRLPVDLSDGTPFQQRVWAQLREIPYGRRVSYRNVAEGIGRPLASRAVGTANGANPIPIVIPCHRVVAADGGLGGYSGGLEIKRSLLELESRTRDHAIQLGMFPRHPGDGAYGGWY